MRSNRATTQLFIGGLGAVAILLLSPWLDPSRWSELWGTFSSWSWPDWSMPSWLTLETVAIVGLPLLALGAAGLLIALLFRAIGQRGDRRRRVVQLADRGVQMPVIARKLNLAQDAVRQLLALAMAGGRPWVPGTFFRDRQAAPAPKLRASVPPVRRTHYEVMA